MQLVDPELSSYGAACNIPAPINRMMVKFASTFRDGVDINLGVGYVDEETIPRDLIKNAMTHVLADPVKYRVALNYGGPKGSPNLIQSLYDFHIKYNIGGLTKDILDKKQIIIGPNGATSLLEGMAHIFKKGIVITSDPKYFIYTSFLERSGYELLTVPEDCHGIQPELLEKKLASLGPRQDEISFVYIVTINNPTGSILKNERRRKIVSIVNKLCRKLNKKIPIIFDKAYELLIHDPAVTPLESSLIYDELDIVYEVGTLSKIVAPSLRVGYLMGPPGKFIQAMVQRTSDAGFSCPLITQEIASYILDYHISEQIKKVNHGYRVKAVAISRYIDEQLKPLGVTYCGGQATFYYYLTLPEGMHTYEGSRFYHFMSRSTGDRSVDCADNGEKKPMVSYIPGNLCVHPKGDLVEIGKRQFRIAYSYESLDKVEEAFGYFKEAILYCKA